MTETTKYLIGSHHPNLYCQSGKETLVLQAYVGLNGTQTEKLGRGMAFLSGGLRIQAPRQESFDLKNQYLRNNHTTLRHDNFILEQRVKNGKEKKGLRLQERNLLLFLRLIPWKMWL